jgi:hypothetical protein
LQSRLSLAIQFRFAIQPRHFLLSPYLPFGFLKIPNDLLRLLFGTKFASPHCLSARKDEEVLAPLRFAWRHPIQELRHAPELLIATPVSVLDKYTPYVLSRKPNCVCRVQLNRCTFQKERLQGQQFAPRLKDF